MRGNEGRRAGLWAGLGGAAAIAGLALALGAPAAGPGGDGGETAARKHSVKLLTKSQRTMLRRGKVGVRVSVRRPMTLRLTGRVRRTGANPARAVRAVKRRSVRMRRAGRRKVALRLTRSGRRELRACRGHRLTVVARRRGTGRRARASDIVRVDSPACDPARSGDVIGGQGGGGGRGRGSRGDIDVTNAHRCDFIDPAHCLFPWPNDHFTARDESTDTDRRLNLHRDSMPKNRAGKPIEPGDYNRNDGFSPGQKVVTKVPGLESKVAFNRTGAVPITDLGQGLDRNQPVVVVNARTRQRHLVWAEIDSNPQSAKDVTLIIRPAVNFAEGERYIVALRDLREADGDFIEAHRGFAVYRDRIITSEPAIERRREHFESLFATLEDARIRRDDLFLAWDFTVASEKNLSERVLSIRDDAFSKLGDTNLADLQVDGQPFQFPFVVRNVHENPDPRILRWIEGSYWVPCYLNSPGCPSGSRFQLPDRANDVKPAAIPGNMMEARFRCAIPKSAETGPAARASLYGHGLLGSREELNQGQLRDFGNEHNIVFCATDWVGMACPDLPDTNIGSFLNDLAAGRVSPPPNCDFPTVLAILQDLSQFPALADRVQQGLVNFLYLGRLMVHPQGLNSHPAFQVQGRGALDTSRLFYDGNSQGGIIGGALAAVGVDHERAVLGVPGMNYSTLLRRSVDFDLYAHGEFVEGRDTPFGLYDNYPNELERPLIISLIQILWDRAEANGYAHHMTSDPLPNTPPHQVLLHVGLGDHQVAQVSAEVEARTIGALHRAPYTDPGRDTDTPPIYGVDPIPSYPYPGSAIVMWDTGPLRNSACDDEEPTGTPPPPPENVPPRCGKDPHEFPRREPSARLQKSEFLKIGGAVIDVCGPRPCYAAGWTGP